MKKISKNSNKNMARFQEALLLGLISVATYLFIALITYHPNDPGWSKVGISLEIENSAGAVGAWIADFTLYFLGYLAYSIPLAVLLLSGLCWLCLRQEQSLREVNLWLLRGFGYLAAVVAACSIASILFGIDNTDLPVSAGGVIGYELHKPLVTAFSKTGALLALFTALLIGTTLATGVSWLKLLQLLLATIIYLFNTSVKLIKSFNVPKFSISAKMRKNARKKMTKPVIQSIRRIEPERITIETSKVKSVAKAKALKPNSALPNVDLLDNAEDKENFTHWSTDTLSKLTTDVEQKLLEFSVETKVSSVLPGPVITRFELELAPGVKASKLTTLSKDLARSLSVTSVRVVEIIPGKSVVGLEIPNQNRELVRLRQIIETSSYVNAESPLSLALGKDIAGEPITVDLAKMPHLLVAGTTGSGKSVGVNAMLLSILLKATPEQVRLLLIDPKMLELSIYEGIGHLLAPVVTDMKDAAKALNWCVAEMERRYMLMATVGVRNISGYNKKIAAAINAGKPIVDPLLPPNAEETTYLETLPYIVVIVDEFADMIMVVGKKVEELIARIAQKARAAGIHLILATQRPSVDVITGLIKANIPTRIAFQVSSRIDSRTILDQQGAEQLLGHGDMLYLAPGAGIPMRVHGAFVSDDEVHRIVNSLKEICPQPDYVEEIATFSSNISPLNIERDEEELDPLYDEAVMIVTASRKASISNLQRRLKVGYNRAARLIETMEDSGVVTAMQSNGSREVLAPPPPEV